MLPYHFQRKFRLTLVAMCSSFQFPNFSFMSHNYMYVCIFVCMNIYVLVYLTLAAELNICYICCQVVNDTYDNYVWVTRKQSLMAAATKMCDAIMKKWQSRIYTCIHTFVLEHYRPAAPKIAELTNMWELRQWLGLCFCFIVVKNNLFSYRDKGRRHLRWDCVSIGVVILH